VGGRRPQLKMGRGEFGWCLAPWVTLCLLAYALSATANASTLEGSGGRANRVLRRDMGLP